MTSLQYLRVPKIPLVGRSFEPLRVLFFGSDGFSIASLKALYKTHQEDRGLIESIDVVCRPGKRVGRGLKNVRHGIGFQDLYSGSLV